MKNHVHPSHVNGITVPRKREGSVTPVLAMSFKKHDHSKRKKRERTPTLKPSHDVRAAHQRHWSSEKVNSILESIKAYQSKSGNVVGRSHILPQEVKDNA